MVCFAEKSRVKVVRPRGLACPLLSFARRLCPPLSREDTKVISVHSTSCRMMSEVCDLSPASRSSPRALTSSSHDAHSSSALASLRLTLKKVRSVVLAAARALAAAARRSRPLIRIPLRLIEAPLCGFRGTARWCFRIRTAQRADSPTSLQPAARLLPPHLPHYAPHSSFLAQAPRARQAHRRLCVHLFLRLSRAAARRCVPLLLPTSPANPVHPSLQQMRSKSA